MCGCFANARGNGAVTIFRTVDNNGFGQAVAITKGVFELCEGASWWNYRRANDIFLLGALQHARHGCLRHMHDFSNFGLPFAFDMVHLGNSGDQSQLIEPCHANLRQ